MQTQSFIAFHRLLLSPRKLTIISRKLISATRRTRALENAAEARQRGAPFPLLLGTFRGVQKKRDFFYFLFHVRSPPIPLDPSVIRRAENTHGCI